MNAVRAWLRRLAGLVSGRRRERELAAELESHLQLHIDDNLRAGMTPEEARRAALLQFGSLEAIREEYRDRSTVRPVETLIQDLRYGARKLRRQPGFTALAVVTLALGVGATAAMFGFVDALMFRTPPYIHQPDRAVRIDEIRSHARYLDISQRLRTLDLAVYMGTTVSLGVGPGAIPIRAECVSPGYFPVLGVTVPVGRAFAADEDTRGGELTAVIAHGLWKRRFGGEHAALGSRVPIAGREHTIIGVAPPGFRGVGLEPVDAWILLAAYPEACSVSPATLRAKGGFWLYTIGRIRDGFTFEEAAADAVAADTNPETVQSRRPDGTFETIALTKVPRLKPIRESRAWDSRLALWLAGGAAVLLLIACANVAGLLSMLAIDRRREIAVRLQLGASRGRVFRQLLVENVLIAGLCGVAAVAVAAWIGMLLRAFYPLADLVNVLDGRTVSVLAGFALLAGLISGVLPAMQASSADPAEHLRTSRALHERSRFRTVLLVAQVALALILIVGAGLFVRSVANFRRDLAYDLDRVIAASVDFSRAGYRDNSAIRARYDLMLERVRQLPEVEAAALSSNVVLGLERSGIVTSISRRAHDEAGCCHAQVAVSPTYFATLGIPILRGRSFTAADTRPSAPPLVVVDEELARTLFPHETAVGQCVVVGFGDAGCAEVVGISQSARRGMLRRTQLDSEFFMPLEEEGVPRVLLVRTRSSARTAVAAIAAAVRSAAPDLPYVRIQALTDLANNEARSWLLGATIFGLFGALAVALAAVGIYGALGFSIRQRTPEIGVRVAFGAEPRDIVRLVLRHGLIVLAAGWVIGGGATIVLTRYVRSLLLDVAPGDAPTFIVASLVIVTAALAGCLIPARRALRIDPAAALRVE